jgi:hypothetical protein
MVVMVHVVKDREYSAYAVYIDSTTCASIAEMEPTLATIVISDKFRCFKHIDELDSTGQPLRTSSLGSVVAWHAACMHDACYI